MLYMQMLTKEEIKEQYPRYKIVVYHKPSQTYIPLENIPNLAIYQVVKGIEELELVG